MFGKLSFELDATTINRLDLLNKKLDEAKSGLIEVENKFQESG